MEGVPVSGPMLQEKAIVLKEKLHQKTGFKTRDGWKWRFCQRNGVHQLSEQGERLSSDADQAKEFVLVRWSFLLFLSCTATAKA